MSGGIRPQDRLAWHRQLTRDPELSSVDIHLGLVISNHFNNGDGECFVGTETLAREVRVSKRTAERAVKALAERDHLKVTQGSGRGLANVYAMVVREPYHTKKNPDTSVGVQPETPTPMTGFPPETPTNETENPVTGDDPTLKEDNSKKERGSEVLSFGKEDNPETATSTSGCRRGGNGRCVLRHHGPQWEAWLKYHQANNPGRASLMKRASESSRYGEWCWEEATEWPPSSVTVLGKQAVGR